MGKRKFENKNGDSSKKLKKDITVEIDNEDDEQPLNDDQAGDSDRVQGPRGYDVKHFRKELASKQGQTMVLTQFLQVCQNPDNKTDILLEYLKCGGNSHEILRQVTQDNKKNLTLATPAFHIFHLIILKVQSSLPHMITITEEACRYFLNNFMSTVEIMISESSGPRHRKIVLKLLTSIVTLNSDLGIEVLNQAPLAPKQLQHIVEKCNYKEKDNVRTCFVHFMTSFLVEGHLPLIKALLEKQGLLGLVIPGLIHDQAEATLMFLNILKKSIIDNALVSKSLKLKMFSQQVLHDMFKIFSWKGPPESHDSKTESRVEITTLLSDILVTLFTNHKIGIYFVDSSLGMTEANKNPSLYRALLTLKRPWLNEAECETILQIVYKCPDLHRAIMTVIEQSFEPQHSPVWEKTSAFVINLLNKLKPEDMVTRMTQLAPPLIANFVRFITLPVPLLKYLQMNIGKDQTISLYCTKVLVKMLQTLRRYMEILDASDLSIIALSDLKNRLEYFLPKHMPSPAAVVALINEVIAGEKLDSTTDYRLPKLNNTEALITLIDLLLLYNDIHPTLFETIEGTIDMKKILDHSVTLHDGQTPLLKFKVVSLWLALDSSAVSLKNPMFKELFLIMLDVYMSDDENTWVEAKDTLRLFLKNTSIFETDEDEVHLVLYALRNSKVNPPSLISDIVVYVLENINDLTEYVRNQLVNFEVSNENNATSLQKLLDDLTENRNTDDYILLENKVPSPFIVGCMQYIQTSREAKKNLKQFLSLYIASLLHSNYSPELTEILISDCKLETRNYVASWLNEPAILPSLIEGQDGILINVSKSIINNEDLSIVEIFPFFQESSAEDMDISVNDTPYKLDVHRYIDNSELVIWAKYLIFCTVKLTDLDQFTPERQKKITDYFHCIITISRKHHQIDICRTILLNLLKNSHVLKMYDPLDLNKGNKGLLATKFLLKVITENKDIIKYLNSKHKVLKSFQQKNYNEIVKAFIKINKRKNVNCDHTIEVLETIGLAPEDDEKVFNLIFGTETEHCVKEDKEPSLVLELLTHLIEKYSQTVALDLQPQILRKCMILYTKLLTNKEINVNLTKLEVCLSQYFENKPHQVNKVSDELFKKFFEVNITRKTTSHLAHVLLKHNIKFCNSFKEQISKPEILSQRELTLPLGSAILNHKSFVLSNKQLLTDIYNEYKSNINKMLEKPHKAGQIYVANTLFVRKLIIECMDIDECAKIFNKIHKFESVELGHTNLIYTIFLKLCAFESVKKEHLMNYFSTMLHLATTAIKEGKEAILIKEIISNIYSGIQICKIIPVLNNLQKDEFKHLIESALWQNFCKAVLKFSLRVKNVGQDFTVEPQTLCLLTHLVRLFYSYDHDDIASLFDMVTSHSEFLNVMLSHHSSDVKSRLIELLYTLIVMNKSVMKAQQIPVYLSSYHATRSPCDRLILAILYHYETSGLPVNEYKPYVWGDSGANYYAVRKNRSSSLWAHPSPNQVLNLFERDITQRTIWNFPVTQTLDYHYQLPSNIDGIGNSVKEELDSMAGDGVFKSVAVKDNEGSLNCLALRCKYRNGLEKLKCRDVSVSHKEEDEGIYDPLFVFPLLSHLLAPGSAASCFKLLRAGLVALPVMALSARCPRLRAAAYHVLHRFCLLLETETRHKNDKLFLTDFINTLKLSLSSAQNNVDDNLEAKNPRLPAIDALYLAKAVTISTAPFHALYKPVNNFFIAKQHLDLTVVPDFLSLFHDSDVESADRRLWILDVIIHGTKTMTDVDVIFKTMCIKMITDYYSSTLCDKKTKEKILEVVGSLVAVPRALEILVEGYGLISWMHAISRQIHKHDKTIAKALLSLVENIIYSLKLNSIARSASLKNNAKTGKNDDFIELKINRDIENEISVIIYESFRNVENLEAEDVLTYLKIYNMISKNTLKHMTKNQVLDVVHRFSRDSEGEEIDLLKKALSSNDSHIILSSKHVDNMAERSCLMKELVKFVQTYIG